MGDAPRVSVATTALRDSGPDSFAVQRATQEYVRQAIARDLLAIVNGTGEFALMQPVTIDEVRINGPGNPLSVTMSGQGLQGAPRRVDLLKQRVQELQRQHAEITCPEMAGTTYTYARLVSSSNTSTHVLILLPRKSGTTHVGRLSVTLLFGAVAVMLLFSIIQWLLAAPAGIVHDMGARPDKDWTMADDPG